MEADLKVRISEYLRERVNTFGFAPVDRFEGAPESHHPARLVKGARTVIVFGLSTPRGVLDSPNYGLHALHRSYHTLYRSLDEIAVHLCNFIESSGPYRALPVPSFAPLVYHGLEPWGIISLKHAAINAGLGRMGRSGQVYHPVYGALPRLGAVVTDATLDANEMLAGSPCPSDCRACFKACPAQAFDGEGNFNKLACLSHSIKHAIYPIALKDEKSLAHIERVINTAGYDYWISCYECLRVCPLNRKPAV
ncbi:MAG: hypothetical protein N2572_05390 [Syntrophales bacterium]|nr:hypothetical protein [Syntrophales bacterium]